MHRQLAGAVGSMQECQTDQPMTYRSHILAKRVIHDIHPGVTDLTKVSPKALYQNSYSIVTNLLNLDSSPAQSRWVP